MELTVTEEAPLRQRAWRPAEIEEPTNRLFIHPLSWTLARHCAFWGIHPNVVSLVGLCCGLGAAVAYGFGRHGWSCVLGFILMVLWHILDGADGQLARLTGKASELGKVMDGLCDHGTFVALYGAIALSSIPQVGAEAILLAAAAGVSHFVQANAYERQRQLYEFVVFRKPVLNPTWDVVPAVLRPVYRGYVAVQQWLSGERWLVSIVGIGPSIPEHVQGAYRRLFRPVVHGWSVLSSNYRTIALFLACLAGMPLAFFWWELIGLTTALILLLAWTRRRQRQFMQEVTTLQNSLDSGLRS